MVDIEDRIGDDADSQALATPRQRGALATVLAGAVFNARLGKQHAPTSRMKTLARAVAAGLWCCAPGGALAAEPAAADAAEESAPAASFQQYDEVLISIGSRRQARSAADSTAPVDTIGGDDFTDQATSDIADLLRLIVPSYNVNTQPIADGGTIVRPANLRGLSPDQTLVLLNGKRRHRAAVITFLGGGLADGAHGPDVGVFPALGIKQVEVLRDGAASQYGSDAIAGVVNFVLKDDAEGGSFEAKAGSTYSGDGDNYRLAGNVGFPLGAGGFANITAEYGATDGTIRSVQRGDALALIAAGNAAVADIGVNGITRQVTQIWGQPEIRDDLKLFVNTGYDLNDAAQLYAFGNHAERTVEGGFFFRHPTGLDNRRIYDGPRVNPATGNAVAVAADGTVRDSVTGATIPAAVASIRVGDLSVDSRGDCPAGIPTIAGGLLPDPKILAIVQADANCFAFVERFPGGFVPRFGGDSTDQSLVAGVRGLLNIGSGLFYDLSYGYGYNKIAYFINNTVNASLGPNTPTAFRPGSYEQIDTNFNLDVAYEVPVAAFDSNLHVAVGFEAREERFDITAGDLASYQLGPLARPSSAFPAGQGFASSSNGFGGFTDSSSNSEDSSAVYAELEADITSSLTLQGALRWEDFSTFGSTTNYKLGGLWRATDQVSVRSTFSTGFRAPTAGQANVTNVSTAFSGAVIMEEGTLPLSSPAGQFVNQALGGRYSLDAESARNFSIGTTFPVHSPVGSFEITVDYFNIVVEDRIAISEQQDFRGLLVAAGMRNGLTLMDMQIAADANGDGSINADDGETSKILNALNAAGVLDASDFSGSEDLATFAFFTNDFDTETWGVDVVASTRFNLFGGDSQLAFALNHTRTEITRAGGLGATRRRQIEENIPQWKGNASLRHYQGDWRCLLRLNFHGSYKEAHLDNGSEWIDADGEITLDAEVGYALTERWELIGGAANLFDNFPVEHPFQRTAGSKYPTTAPFGLSGGQYYLKARYDW